MDWQNERKSQQFAIRLSFTFGIIMLAVKWYAFVLTGSSAILSDAAESVVHVVAVGFAAYSMWLMYQPPDASHPYGHDKISFFSAGVEGFLILVAAGYIIYQSIKKLIFGIALQNLNTGMFFTLGASLVNLGLGTYLVWQGKRGKSLILIANGKHVLTDSWTSFGVVGGLLLVMWTGWLPFDPLFAIVVALNIVWSGGKLVRQSVGGLMDEASLDLEKRINSILNAETARRGLRYHQMRCRESGNAIWVEYHLLFPGDTLLHDAHLVATEIESIINRSLHRPARIVSHLEPAAGHDEIHDQQLRH